jgi:hypothetical protein
VTVVSEDRPGVFAGSVRVVTIYENESGACEPEDATRATQIEYDADGKWLGESLLDLSQPT